MFIEPIRFELLHRNPKTNIPKNMNIKDLKAFIVNNVIVNDIVEKIVNLKI